MFKEARDAWISRNVLCGQCGKPVRFCDKPEWERYRTCASCYYASLGSDRGIHR